MTEDKTGDLQSGRQLEVVVPVSQERVQLIKELAALVQQLRSDMMGRHSAPIVCKAPPADITSTARKTFISIPAIN